MKNYLREVRKKSGMEGSKMGDLVQRVHPKSICELSDTDTADEQRRQQKLEKGQNVQCCQCKHRAHASLLPIC